MRIIFAGTPDFAAHSLSALCTANHEIVCVYTQPDRKTGRGQKVTAPAVKVEALKNNIEVRQPLSFKSDIDYEDLKALNADLMIVVAYGMLLPQRVLDVPKYGCLNIHASLLPRWRGAAPIQRAIEAGDEETGVCIMQMEAGLDTGPVIQRETIPIKTTDTSASLHDKLAELGALALLSTLNTLEEKLHTAKAQDHNSACYAHKITKAEANLDWHESANSIAQKIRAFNPWPICQSSYHNNDQEQRIRIWQAAAITSSSSDTTPGTILSMDKNGLQVSCGEGILSIQTLQRDGSKPLAIRDFINSTSLQVGDQFSSIKAIKGE